MKISDIITENTGSLQSGIVHALPDTQVFPELKNTDPYTQYRFGLAVAAAGAVKAGETTYNKESAFGEDLTMVARGPEEKEIIELAKRLYGAGATSKQVSTTKSEESKDVNKNSPVANLGPVKRKNEN